MNKKILKLAKKAGFCAWGKEKWRPEGAYIDWSSNYDEDLEKIVQLTVKDCIKKFADNDGNFYETVNRLETKYGFKNDIVYN